MITDDNLTYYCKKTVIIFENEKGESIKKNVKHQNTHQSGLTIKLMGALRCYKSG